MKTRILNSSPITHVRLSLQLRREHKRIEESKKKLAETTLVPGFTKIYC